MADLSLFTAAKPANGRLLAWSAGSTTADTELMAATRTSYATIVCRVGYVPASRPICGIEEQRNSELLEQPLPKSAFATLSY